LRHRIVLLGSAPIPLHRLLIIERNSLPGVITNPQITLRLRISLLSGFAQLVE